MLTCAGWDGGWQFKGVYYRNAKTDRNGHGGLMITLGWQGVFDTISGQFPDIFFQCPEFPDIFFQCPDYPDIFFPCPEFPDIFSRTIFSLARISGHFCRDIYITSSMGEGKMKKYVLHFI